MFHEKSIVAVKLGEKRDCEVRSMKAKQKKDRLERLILLYFDFLVTDDSFAYRKRIYPDYMGFPGPIHVYSFFNDNGCLSFHYIAQKDELGLYTAGHDSDHQYQLLQREVSTSELCGRKVFTKKQLFSEIANQLRKEAKENGTVLGIKV